MLSYHQHYPMYRNPNIHEDHGGIVYPGHNQNHPIKFQENILIVKNRKQGEDDDVSVLSDDSAMLEMNLKNQWKNGVMNSMISHGSNSRLNDTNRSKWRAEMRRKSTDKVNLRNSVNSRCAADDVYGNDMPRSSSRPEYRDMQRGSMEKSSIPRNARSEEINPNHYRAEVRRNSEEKQHALHRPNASESLDNSADIVSSASPPNQKVYNRLYQPSAHEERYNAYENSYQDEGLAVKNHCRRVHAVNIQELMDTFPAGGEFYDLSTYSSKLDVKFYYPRELHDSLYLECPYNFIQSLGDRPVIGYMLASSPLHEKGVAIGDVLLAVNDVQVSTPEEANRQIKRSRRPLKLLLYAPDVKLTVSEGFHMVKYDVNTFKPPKSSVIWKPKYVVVGGVIATNPHTMHMYRSKDEYDIAVMETVAKKPISVKIKSFSLVGASLEMDNAGNHIHSIMYDDKEWKYILVCPEGRKEKPIKIASTTEIGLKAVYDAVRRCIHQTEHAGEMGSEQNSATKVLRRSLFPLNRRRATM